MEVDHKTRPTFHQLVPELEALLNDGHKKYYDSMNEMFKNKSIDENIILRREPFQKDLKPKSGVQPSTLSTPPVVPNNTDSNTGYLQPVLNNNYNNNNNNNVKPVQTGYLMPQLTAPNNLNQTGYLQPVMNQLPPAKPLINTDGYLLPSTTNKVS